MTPHIPLMVPGAEPDGEPVSITAPFDGSLIATVEKGGADAVNKALATAHGLFRSRRLRQHTGLRDVCCRRCRLLSQRHILGAIHRTINHRHRVVRDRLAERRNKIARGLHTDTFSGLFRTRTYLTAENAF